MSTPPDKPSLHHRPAPDWPFVGIMVAIGGTYVAVILLMLAADLCYTTPDDMWAALKKPEIQYSIKLTLVSCTITAILSVWVAIPLGYLLSRYEFRGKSLLDAILDIPIVLPPLVVGLSLLILFQFLPRSVHGAVIYQLPAVVIAQFMVACAFAVRTVRITFGESDLRKEQVALTLGCSRWQAFSRVVFPEARQD